MRGQARSAAALRRLVEGRKRRRDHRALRILRGQAAREATDPRYAARKKKERRRAKEWKREARSRRIKAAQVAA